MMLSNKYRGVLSILIFTKEVIKVREENDLLVLDEGVEAGVVQTCCTAGTAKV